MSLKERLQLEYEILDRLDSARTSAGEEEVTEELERAIIEHELAELEKHTQAEPILVPVRRRRAA
ncbi:MAG: hypothetical protein HY821_04590 [Acidobacteria bacterium]|nr:hypothetical protein [Acidobacteriota bacterium]